MMLKIIPLEKQSRNYLKRYLYVHTNILMIESKKTFDSTLSGLRPGSVNPKLPSAEHKKILYCGVRINRHHETTHLTHDTTHHDGARDSARVIHQTERISGADCLRVIVLHEISASRASKSFSARHRYI